MLERAAGWALAATLAAAACGWRLLAVVSALGMTAAALWSLLRWGSARSRLQTGIAVPLLMILSPATLWPALYVACAAVVVAVREETMVARIASLLTILFPAGLLLLVKAYLLWVGYRPFWA
ncbi:MAG: hypothetical protein NZR01_04690 [Bryobacteraceae bacterium]|nr:hypothetical protein [Bryobacteraceae bacterium]